MIDTAPELLAAQRAALRREGGAGLATRIDRINRCIALLVDNSEALCAAVNADFGCRSRHVTRMSDIYTSINTLKFVRKNLKRWMTVEKRKAMFPMGLLGGRAEIHYQAKGVVGIMSPWNVPVNLIFGPMADALGAGNRVMLKPSEYTPQTTALLQRLLSESFALDEVAVVTGGPEIGAEFSALPFDHLMYTGSTAIGKRVMQAAAANLTPVTLELGGKSPVIIADDADLSDCVDKMISFKAMNAGQVCLSPDYCFVPADKLDQFIRLSRALIDTLYPQLLGNGDYVSMINAANYERVCSYLDDAADKCEQIVILSDDSSDWRASDGYKIPPHLLINPQDQALAMQEELFGPLLCVKTYTNLEQCIEVINSRPHPLALYYFGKDRQQQQQVLMHTRSGGVCINDIAVHFACDDLPFGGIGDSGMGHYHGREGFKTFSHARAVYRQGWINLQKLSGSLPPYGEKIDKMMNSMLKK